MNWVALKILFGDRGKYLGLVFGIAFATLLIGQQCSIFVGIMRRTASFILEMRDVDVWVMDKRVNNIEIIEPMRDTAVDIVRAVPGVRFAVPLLKAVSVVKTLDGEMNQAMVIGLDDAALVGAPRRFIVGNARNLFKSDAVILDSVGYRLLWPNQSEYKLGQVMELNDKRAVLQGVVDVTPAFQFMPIVYTRYHEALNYTNGGRKRMSFILVKAQAGVSPEKLAKRISDTTPFRALVRNDFIWSTVAYYIRNTGIPINFGVTVFLGVLVGATIVGLLLNMFVSDNIRQFGALKAMGLDNRRLTMMVLLEALVVYVIGFSLGSGLAALFFIRATNTKALKGLYMPWYVWLFAASLIFLVTMISSWFSLRRVRKVDPAIVFKG